jgi:2-keto-4-pentenoate hydratase/2-oxohepta-3-ene-1,7-dioic acid hydratase in catechol pathway
MKTCRFLHQGLARYGRVEERDGALWIAGPAPIPAEDLAAQLAELRGAAATAFDPMPLNTAELLPPVVPGKMVCVGRNYRDHVKELGNEVPAEPLIFFKPISSLLAPGATVRMPRVSERIDFEGELVVLIGRRASRLKSDADWRSYVRAYTIANDVTARDLQKKDGQWTRAKGFDTFCPVGPILSDEVDPESGLIVETRVNGELRQHGTTADFIFPIPQLLAYITAAITLEPGDLLLTGTPAGVAPLAPGDRVEVSVTGLDTLANCFAAEEG